MTTSPPRLSLRMAALYPAAFLPVLLASPALAQISTTGNLQYSTSLSSLLVNSTISTVYLGTSSKDGLVSSAAMSTGSGAEAANIAFSGTSGIYHGSVTGLAAAPYTPAGVQTSNYFSAEPSGNVTISYASQQRYFGMLWGSVDKYNTLAFYDGTKLVGELTGSNVSANAAGSRGADGSYFVNINFSGVTYDRVVATSSSPAFEFGLISASQTTQNIAPAPLPLPGGTPAGIAALVSAVLLRAGVRLPRQKRPA